MAEAFEMSQVQDWHKEGLELIKELSEKDQSFVKESCIDHLMENIKSFETDINDPIDFQYALALKYAESKAKWVQSNLSMNYQMSKGQAIDPKDQYIASLTSGFLIILEKFIDPKIQSEIHELLDKKICG